MAASNNGNNSNNENNSNVDSTMSQNEKNIAANQRVAQTGVKSATTAAGAYFGGGAGAQIGSKVGDAVNNSKIGQADTRTVGQAANEVNKKVPMGNKLQDLTNKAVDSGAMDIADKGIDKVASAAGGSPGMTMNNNVPKFAKPAETKNINSGMANNITNTGVNNPKNVSNVTKKGSNNLADLESSDIDTESLNNSLPDKESDTEDKGTNEDNQTLKDDSEEPSQEQPNQLFSGKKTKNIAAQAIIKALLPIVITILPILLIIILVLFVIIIVSSMVPSFDSILDFLNLNGEECAIVQECDYIELSNGERYNVEDYLVGAVNRYFGDYENEKVFQAMGIVVHADMLDNISLTNDDGVCTLGSMSKYPEVIPIYNEEGISEKEALIRSNVIKTEYYTIKGYFGLYEADTTALDNIGFFDDYKDVLKDYLRIDELSDEDVEFEIVKICNANDQRVSYISTCNTVTITSGDYMGDYELEEYIAGVVNNEVGGFQDLETYKAFAVAIRSYLARTATIENNVCYVENTSNYMTFRPTNNSLILEAVDATRGEYVMQEGEPIVAMFDAFCWEDKDNDNYYLAQKHQAIPVSWALSTVSTSSYLQNKCGTSGSGGHGEGMSQYGAYYLSTVGNQDYQAILQYYYGVEIEFRQGITANAEGYIIPVDNFSYISGEFTGYCGSGSPHNGIDFAAPAGIPIYSAHDGVVIRTYNYGGRICDGSVNTYGIGYKIQNTDGTYSIYAHMSRSAGLTNGSTVSAGQIIGYVGTTGCSTGNHLHYEMHDAKDLKVNPRNYIPLDAEGYPVCWRP